MTDCVVMVEANSGRSRGFGFVTFVSHDALEAVLASKQIVDGKEVSDLFIYRLTVRRPALER